MQESVQSTTAAALDSFKTRSQAAIEELEEEIERARGRVASKESEFDVMMSTLSKDLSLKRPAGLERQIYDARHGSELPGALARSEGEPEVADADVNRLYDVFGVIYRFLQEVFGRDSIDGHGGPLVGTVHFRRRFNNGFWDGQRVVFGDGDGKIFRTFLSLDIVTAELTKGMIQPSTGLIYEGPSGALLNHFSDVFGVLAVQWNRQETVEQSDWLIGAESLGPDIQGEALRSLKAPGTAYDDKLLGEDPQPSHMDGYVRTDADNGGVHINSGIPNHAFYRVATDLGGHAWEKAGQIWYRSMLGLDNPRADFVELARTTVRVAGELFGDAGDERQAVVRGWKAVGIEAS